MGGVMKKILLFKTMLLLLLSITIVGCNNGSSTASSTTASSSVQQVQNLDASQWQQWANPNVAVGTANNKLATSCLIASKLSFESSSSAWYASGSFSIDNTCSSAQQLNGSVVVLTGGSASDVWGGVWSINSFSPWLGSAPNYTTQSSGNQLRVTLNNSYSLGSNQAVKVIFGYQRNNQPLTMSGASVAMSNSTPTTGASLDVNVNTTALASTCTLSNPCNIMLNLFDSNKQLYKTVTTVTTTTGVYSYHLSNLIPGNYMLTANNLPAKASLTPVTFGLTAGQLTSISANFSVTNPQNNCLTATMGALTSSAWWTSGTFTLKNTCNGAQDLVGTTIAIASTNSSDIISGFQLNSTAPVYIANFATITSSANTVLLTVTSNGGSLSAGGAMSVTFGYSPGGGLLKGNLLASINGATPVANANLAVTLDSSGLSAYCVAATPCNIPLLLTSQGNAFSQTLTTLTTTTGKTVFNISKLNPGTYTVTTANLPADLIANYNPSSQVVIAGGESAALSLALSVKPATTGSLKFSLVNPQPSLFAESGLVAAIKGTNASTSVAAIFGQTVTTNLSAGTYTVTIGGLAAAGGGVYYRYPVQNAVVAVNTLTNLNAIAAIAESNVVPTTWSLNGLSKGDSATIVFSDNQHLYNSEVVTATQESASIAVPFKFINGSTVTLNVQLNNHYQSFAPVTVTIGANQSYTLNFAKQQVPSQHIVGYYETWLARATWESATYSLANIPPYVTIIPLAFAKPDAVYTAGSYNFTGAGLGIAATKDVALGAIKLAQAKGQVILLSVGGATYPNFAGLRVNDLMALVKDLGVDGIDLDYEADTAGCSGLNGSNLSCPTDSQMINVINGLRSGLDQLQANSGRKMYLTAAVWSIGAYGSAAFPTTQNGPVGTKSGLWVNPLRQVGNKFDSLFLMSYDAGNATSTGYQPLNALKAYKALYTGPIYLGVEVPPEAWGGNVSTPSQVLANASTAAQGGAAGTMLWALEVQGTANGVAVNSMSYLQPLCNLYGLTQCSMPIPLN